MAVEHKKLLMKEYQETGKNKEEIDKLSGDIDKLQEILMKLDEKTKKKAKALEDLQRDKK